MRKTIGTRRAPSLLGRVLAWTLALFVAGGIVTTLAALANARIAAREAYDRLLIGAASDIAEAIELRAGQPQITLPVSAFQLLAQARDDRVAYMVIAPSGEVLAGLPIDGTPLPQSPDAVVYYDLRLQGDPARGVVIGRQFSERDFSGMVTIALAQTTRARDALSFKLLRNTLVVAAIAGVILLAVAGIVIRAAFAPLNRIAADLVARDPYDLTPITPDAPAEMAVFIEAINRFMRRLDRQIDILRNLISDSAHQLRTPVAAIRAQAELMTENPDTVARDLDRLLRRTRSLGHLLDQLLARAMVMHRVDNGPRTRLDLRDIALDIIEAGDHALIAPEANIGLDIGPDPVRVLGDPMSLSEAAKNLLSNALTHGAPPVRLGVSTEGPWAALWVEDGGAGLPQATSEALSRRFKRSRTSTEGGTGLGLSIAAEVAHGLDGRILTDHRAGRFRVSILIPLDPSATEGERP